MRTMNQAEVIRRLRKACRNGQAQWAAEHGISPAYVSEVLSGRKDPGPAILAALNLERETVYRRAQ